MFVTLDISHFEMSDLNAVAPANAAESKKEKTEREEKRGEVRHRVRRTNRENFRAKKEEEMGKEGKRERSL